jgi:hypothetical protein
MGAALFAESLMNEQSQPGRDATLERAAFRALEQLARALGEAADKGRAVKTRWDALGGDPARGLTFTVEIGPTAPQGAGTALSNFTS